MTLRIAAPAKLNLFLHITGKRHDDYHLLESLVAFSEFGDALDIAPAERLSLKTTGPFAASLQPDENNSVIKAAQLLKVHSGYKAGAHITLEKNIPVGAGLGGGSSDAAAALLGLKKLWNIDIDDNALQKIALQAGSDVPVCLTRQTGWMRGIGEDITPVTMRADVWAALVNPGLALLTADVFRNFSSAFAPLDNVPKFIDSFDALISLIEPKHNMLEKPAIALMPVITDVLNAIRATEGCKLARMSGSGATCFGLYDNAEKARQAASDIGRRHPAWWSIATKLQLSS